jgi:hypothetical protein
VGQISGTVSFNATSLRDSISIQGGNQVYGDFVVSTHTVPEPSSALMAGFAALAGLGEWARRRWAASRAG